jgi:AraC-like DNA-binding protein
MGQKDPITSPGGASPQHWGRENPPILRFSTTHLAPRDQFAAWQNVNDPLLDTALPPDTAPSAGYAASLTAYNLGGLIFSSETFDALIYELTAPGLRRGQVDHWVLSLNKRGHFASRTDGVITESNPGSLSLRSLTRPFKGRSSSIDILFVYIPRDMFPELAGAFDALGNVKLTGGLSAILAEFLLLLEKRLPFVSEEDIPRIGRATQAMIASCLVPRPDSLSAARAEISATLVERARRHIRNNIHAASLSPDELCRVLGVSRTQLYRAFELTGGVAREIRSQRLCASHAALTNAADRRRVYDIAQAFGFSSADEFGRAFRREFGYSPREARRLAADSVLHPAPMPDAGFGGWLRGLSQ